MASGHSPAQSARDILSCDFVLDLFIDSLLIDNLCGHHLACLSQLIALDQGISTLGPLHHFPCRPILVPMIVFYKYLVSDSAAELSLCFLLDRFTNNKHAHIHFVLTVLPPTICVSFSALLSATYNPFHLEHCIFNAYWTSAGLS